MSRLCLCALMVCICFLVIWPQHSWFHDAAEPKRPPPCPCVYTDKSWFIMNTMMAKQLVNTFSHYPHGYAYWTENISSGGSLGHHGEVHCVFSNHIKAQTCS